MDHIVEPGKCPTVEMRRGPDEKHPDGCVLHVNAHAKDDQAYWKAQGYEVVGPSPVAKPAKAKKAEPVEPVVPAGDAPAEPTAKPAAKRSSKKKADAAEPAK